MKKPDCIYYEEEHCLNTTPARKCWPEAPFCIYCPRTKCLTHGDFQEYKEVSWDAELFDAMIDLIDGVEDFVRRDCPRCALIWKKERLKNLIAEKIGEKHDYKF